MQKLKTAAISMLLLLATTAIAQDQLPPQTLFTNVHVWDGTSEGITQRINVLVENNLIKKIRADASDAHAEATVIDAPGKILMPGLIDSHSHLNMNGDGGLVAMAGMRWDEIASRSVAQAQDWFADGFTRTSLRLPVTATWFSALKTRHRTAVTTCVLE